MPRPNTAPEGAGYCWDWDAHEGKHTGLKSRRNREPECYLLDRGGNRNAGGSSRQVTEVAHQMLLPVRAQLGGMVDSHTAGKWLARWEKILPAVQVQELPAQGVLSTCRCGPGRRRQTIVMWEQDQRLGLFEDRRPVTPLNFGGDLITRLGWFGTKRGRYPEDTLLHELAHWCDVWWRWADGEGPPPPHGASWRAWYWFLAREWTAERSMVRRDTARRCRVMRVDGERCGHMTKDGGGVCRLHRGRRRQGHTLTFADE